MGESVAPPLLNWPNKSLCHDLFFSCKCNPFFPECFLIEHQFVDITFHGSSGLSVRDGIVLYDLKAPATSKMSYIRRRWILFTIDDEFYTKELLEAKERSGEPYTITFDVIGQDPPVHSFFKWGFRFWLFIFGYFSGCNLEIFWCITFNRNRLSFHIIFLQKRKKSSSMNISWNESFIGFIVYESTAKQSSSPPPQGGSSNV